MQYEPLCCDLPLKTCRDCAQTGESGGGKRELQPASMAQRDSTLYDSGEEPEGAQPI